MRCDALLEQWFRPNSNYINSLAKSIESVNDKSLSTADKVHGPGLLHPFPNQD